MNLKMISLLMVMVGMYKLVSSREMIITLISLEMIMVGTFISFSLLSWAFINPIVMFLVMVVIDGVLGLLIITSFFQSSSISSSSSIMF